MTNRSCSWLVSRLNNYKEFEDSNALLFNKKKNSHGCFVLLNTGTNAVMLELLYSGFLTKKFIHLIKHAEDGILDLNKAADTLEVSVFLL